MSSEVRSVTRVGVLGDVHAQDVRLERAFAAFDSAGLDAVLCVGDVVDGDGDVGRAIARLVERGVLVVAGNHERWFLANEMRSLPYATTELDASQREVIASWPRTRDFQTPLGGMRLGHGIGEHDMVELRPDTKGYALQAVTGLRELMLDPSVRYHVGGHTHERMVRVFQGLVAINAGTLEGDEPTALVLDFEQRTATFLDLGDDGRPPLDVVTLPEPAPIPGLS